MARAIKDFMKNVWRSLIASAVVMIVGGLCFILWEQRTTRTSPAATAARTDTISMTSVHAGGSPAADLSDPEIKTHEELSASDISEGKRLYSWFNCNTCHANGGGDIGPPLMDANWLYGAEPRNIRASILEGRPNGMPSFRGKIPEAQVWQIVAYVRSMSGHVPFYAPPGRNDDLSAKEPETQAPHESVHSGGQPASDARSNTK